MHNYAILWIIFLISHCLPEFCSFWIQHLKLISLFLDKLQNIFEYHEGVTKDFQNRQFITQSLKSWYVRECGVDVCIMLFAKLILKYNLTQCSTFLILMQVTLFS